MIPDMCFAKADHRMNALAQSASPYLRQHADNPVAWLPWGEEAFAESRRTGKPIFLSVGYATCHWCHVMAHESFEDSTLAEIINRDFVPVKVDREERPDVDRAYMTYVVARTGQGGWPLTVFLTPELQPFFGGTYFAPEDAAGRPGLRTLLNAIAHAWETRREDVVAEGRRTAELLARSAEEQARNPGKRSGGCGCGSKKAAQAEAEEEHGCCGGGGCCGCKDEQDHGAEAHECACESEGGGHGGCGCKGHDDEEAHGHGECGCSGHGDDSHGGRGEGGCGCGRNERRGGCGCSDSEDEDDHAHGHGNGHRCGCSGGEEATAETETEAAPVAAGIDLAFSGELLSRSWGGAWNALLRALDKDNGGFGGAPKFPQPSNLSFLLRVAQTCDDPRLREEAMGIVSQALAAMARGGIHDHVGGGFHRYSVDEAWCVPHFEKMLYDQAQLAALCVEAWRASGDERHAWLARDILGYCLRDLRDDSGAFCSAEDADSPVDRSPGATVREGAYYVWRHSELREIIAEQDWPFANRLFALSESGNVPDALDPHGELTDRNILRQLAPLDQVAREVGLAAGEASAARMRVLSALRLARGRRPRPLRDGKIVAAWNGLMISALARASLCDAAAFTERWEDVPAAQAYPGNGYEQCRAAALVAAEAAWTLLWDSAAGRLHRSWCAGARGPLAVAADHAFLAQGFLDLHAATLEPLWLERAQLLQGLLDQLFSAPSGGYFDSSSEATDLYLRQEDDHDGAEPAASSIALLNLLRLSALLGDKALEDRAGRLLVALAPTLRVAPHGRTSALVALEWAAAWPPRSAILAARRDDPRVQDALRRLFRQPGPPCVTLSVAPGDETTPFVAARPWLSAIATRLRPGEAHLYACDGTACSEPELL